jgi:hypothetical protein
MTCRAQTGAFKLCLNEVNWRPFCRRFAGKSVPQTVRMSTLQNTPADATSLVSSTLEHHLPAGRAFGYRQLALATDGSR